ncbi:MAG: hypothetical protein JSS02_01540 [Planctomycetes bacterium]|nr:hypothetical protein [Planctomycetota bacterium]
MIRNFAVSLLILAMGVWAGSARIQAAQDSVSPQDGVEKSDSAKKPKASDADQATEQKPVGEKPRDSQSTGKNEQDAAAETPSKKEADTSSEDGQKPAGTGDEKNEKKDSATDKGTDNDDGDKEKSPTSKSTGSPPASGGAGDSRPWRRPRGSDAASIIADFTTGQPGTGDAKSPAAKLLSFKFVKAPWTQVLELFAKEAGLTLDLEETPPGTFTYTDNKRYTPTEALDIINGYLLKRGFLLIRRDQFLVVWNFDSPPPPNLVPLVSIEELTRRGRNEYVSVLIPLGTSIDAKSAKEEITDLLGPQGKSQAMVKSNQLKVSDIGSNLILIEEFLRDIETTAEKGQTKFKAIPILNISATEAERQVRDAFGLPTRSAAAKAAAEAAAGKTTPQNNRQNAAPDFRSMIFGGRGGGGGFPFGGGGIPGMMGGGSPPSGGGDSGGGGDGGGRGGRGRNRGGDQGGQSDDSSTFKIQLAANTRTNHLLVIAPVEELRLVEEAVKAIDVKQEAAERSANRGPRDPKLVPYTIKTADLDVVSDLVATLVPGIVVHEDMKTRRLNIFATPSEHREIGKIIEEVDMGVGRVTVIELNRLPASQTAASLQKLFATNNRGEPPTIEADDIGRRLMVRGSPDQLEEIETLLRSMGEMGRNDSNPRQRTILPRNRTAVDVISEFEEQLSDQDAETIQVIKPTETRRSRSGGSRSANPDRPGAGSGMTPASPRTGGGAPERGGRGFQRTIRLRPDINPESVIPGGIRRETPDDSQPGRATPVPEKAPEKPGVGKAGSAAPSNVAVAESVSDDGLMAYAPPEENDDEQEPEAAPVELPRRGRKTPAARPRAEVIVEVRGDQISIYCEDEDELNRVARQIELLAKAPPKLKMVVHPLTVPNSTSDTSAAVRNMLQLEGVQTRTTPPSSTTTSVFSLFGSSRNTTPEPSTLSSANANSEILLVDVDPSRNALILVGPAESVDLAIEKIKLIEDAGPRWRNIKLRHGRVQHVAEALYEVYQTEIAQTQNRGAGPQQPQFGIGGQMGGFNPMQMNNQQQRRPQLAISAMTVTNSLAIYSNESMYLEIKERVAEFEEEMQALKPTTRVHAATRANSAVVQQALSALVEGVRTTTVAANAPTNNSGGQRGPQSQFGGQGLNGPGFGGQGFGGQGMGFPGFFGQQGGFGGQGFGGQGMGGRGFGGQGFGGQGFGGQGFGGGRGGQGFGGGGRGGRGGN